MKKKIGLVTSALLCAWMIHAQVLTSADIKGTPYLNEQYEKGVVQFIKKSQVIQLRYNAFQDLMEYQENGMARVFDPNENIRRISLNNSVYMPLKTTINGRTKWGFFELLDSGKVMLYVKKKIIFVQAKARGALDGSDQPAEYKQANDTYFFRVGDGELKEVDNIKDMIASFPDKQEEVTVFAKKEKISPRKEKKLIQLTRYYNTQ
jgi:hypothetical protein